MRVAFVKLFFFFGAIVGHSWSSTQKDISPIEKSCFKSESSKSSLVIVSTLDGKLTAFDANDNGNLVWEMAGDGGPLLSSSLSSFKAGVHGNGLHLIPSLNGILFKLEGDQVEAVPLNTETLLDSRQPLPDGSVLVGGRDATTCGVNPDSGQMRYACSAKGCQLVDESSVHITQDNVLIIRRQQRTVRAVDARTGHERWNYSVGLHDLSLALGMDEFTGRPKCSGRDKRLDWSVQVSLMDRMVAVVRHDGPNPVTPIVMWTRTLPTPIAGAWIMNGEFLEEVNLFAENVLPQLIDKPELRNAPSMFLGVHEGQTYIQTPREILAAINKATVTSVAVHQNSKKPHHKERLRLSWKPYLATSSSRTPTLISKELVVWNSHEYPFDNGYYMFGQIQPVIPIHKDRKSRVISEDTFRKWNSSKTCPGPKSEKIHDAIGDRGSLLLWWKEVLALTMCSSFLAQYFLWRLLFSKKRESLDSGIHRTYSHVSVGTSSVTVNTFTDSDLQLNPGLAPVTPTVIAENYTSRFYADFVPEQCLGKGGFGVVFQSKNKIDECSYAIKRIKLPNCKEAQVKVMREVKAMAKLEHVGIVRYFNAWFEAPPPGWQEERDQKFIEESSMTCPSMFTFDEPQTRLRRRTASTKSDSSQKNRRRTKSGGSSRSRHSSYNSTVSKGDGSSGVTIEGDGDLSRAKNMDELIETNGQKSCTIDIESKKRMIGLDGLDKSESFGIEFVDETSSSKHVGFQGKRHSKNIGDNSHSQRLSNLEDSSSFDIEFTETSGLHLKSDASKDNSVSDKATDDTESEEEDSDSEEESSEWDVVGHEDSTSWGVEDIIAQNELNTKRESSQNDHDIPPLKDLHPDGTRGVNFKAKSHPPRTLVSSVQTEHDESGSFSIEFADNSVDKDNCEEEKDSDSEDEENTCPDNLGETTERTGDSGNVTLECSSSTSRPKNWECNDETEATASMLTSTHKSVCSEMATQTPLGGPLFLYIQMQLCRRDTLKTWLNENPDNRDPFYCLQIFDQIVSAVEYFHGQGMIHRDLKPSNIFFSLDGVVKVGDFGLVTGLDATGTRTDSNGYAGGRHTGPVGTQLYMSPEQVIGQSYNYKVDIYSLGLIFFELCQSFGTQMERITTMMSLRQQRFPDPFAADKPKHVEFVSWLISEDPVNRPTAADIKESLLLTEIRRDEQDAQPPTTLPEESESVKSQ